MSELQGRRLPDNLEEDVTKPFRWDDIQSGDYWFVTHMDHRDLWFRDPNGNVGRCCKHTLTEHEDGTVTVEPSILDRDVDGTELFHGWLRRGIWSW